MSSMCLNAASLHIILNDYITKAHRHDVISLLGQPFYRQVDHDLFCDISYISTGLPVKTHSLHSFVYNVQVPNVSTVILALFALFLQLTCSCSNDQSR